MLSRGISSGDWTTVDLMILSRTRMITLPLKIIMTELRPGVLTPLRNYLSKQLIDFSFSLEFDFFSPDTFSHYLVKLTRTP